jgi:rhamnosyltransferase
VVLGRGYKVIETNEYCSCELPKVAVLLAAYNGEKWIRTQIDSILAQRDVQVELFISLDVSSDSTTEILEEFNTSYPNIHLLTYGERFGGAAPNFYRLIKEVDTSGYDYVSFADQDDIWAQDKLVESIKSMRHSRAVAFSSDVTAFWPDGREKIVKKSDAQRRYDYLFESAGPGCSYVFQSDSFQLFKEFLVVHWNQVSSIEFHDWLAYAFFRSKGMRWHIGSRPLMRYRQHSDNQFGANSSLTAAIRRLQLIKNGWYKHEVRQISAALGRRRPTAAFIFLNFRDTRRKLSDSLTMLFVAVFF